MKKLKVYGWRGYRNECPPAPNGSLQTREICAATSMAEVARIAGVKRPSQLFDLCETGNEREIPVAMAQPGVIFWKPLNARYDEFRAASS